MPGRTRYKERISPLHLKHGGVMEHVRVQPQDASADLGRFRRYIDTACRGDARARPRDCTGRRFLVRDDFYDTFTEMAGRYGLSVEREHG